MPSKEVKKMFDNVIMKILIIRNLQDHLLQHFIKCWGPFNGILYRDCSMIDTAEKYIALGTKRAVAKIPMPSLLGYLTEVKLIKGY